MQLRHVSAPLQDGVKRRDGVTLGTLGFLIIITFLMYEQNMQKSHPISREKTPADFDQPIRVLAN